MVETYLNASSLGLPSARTLARMHTHLGLELDVGPVRAASMIADEVSSVRPSAARLLSAREEDVGLASSTFAAWYAVVTRLPLAGRRLLVAPHEWGENVVALKRLAASTGATVDVLPGEELAALDPQSWAARIDEDVAALFVPMVTSVAGLRYPVEAIGALPRAPGTALVVDAAQALGRVDVDVTALGCDALVATARKWLRGPRGTALFWLKPGGATGLAIDEIEPFDANIALRLGLGVAIDEALDRGVAGTASTLRRLSDHAAALAVRYGIALFVDGHVSPGTCAVSIPSERVAIVRKRLLEERYHVKWPTPRRDEPLSGGPSVGFEPLRITPHVYNDVADLDGLFECLAKASRSG